MYNEGGIDFFKWQLEYVQDQIKVADSKINFLLAIYLVLLGVGVAQAEKVIEIFLNASACLEWKVVIGIVYMAFLFCVANFFWHFISTMKPRTEPQEILGKDYRSYIFWKDISEMGYKNFRDASLKTLYSDLGKQVFVNSHIAKAKFENVNSAYKLFFLTLIIFLILFIFIHLIGN